MADIPNTHLINFVDIAAAIHYSQFGDSFVQLDPQNQIIDVHEFRKVSIQIGSTSATSCEIFMGKLSNTTLGAKYNVPLDSQIHSFEVVGPEMALALKGGAPNSGEQGQLWVYLRS